MKNTYKKLILLFSALLGICQMQAQTVVTIPSGNTATTVTNTTVHRKPYGSLRAYERSAMKYTQAEIGMMGTITDIGFYCDSVNSPGKTAVKIYLKEVTDSTFTASTVTTEETGATLVYSDTIYPASFVKNTWVTVTLTTPFVHATTNNIEVIIETNNTGGTSGSDNPNAVAKGFRASTVTGARMQYWQSPNGSGTAPAGNGTLVNPNTRSNVQFTISPLASCTAPPTAGTTTGPSSVCSGSAVALGLSGNSIGTGLTYQWISSTNGTTWSNIGGATGTAYTATVTAATYYACVLTCSGQSDTSSVLHITLNPFYNCYCTSGIGGGCGTTAIDSVAITTTTLANGLTGCSTGNYTMYPASGNTTASLTQGIPYVLAAKFTGNTKTSVWIDYNHSGTFDNNEWTQVCLTSTAGTVVTTTITVPFTSLTGLTGMRVRSRSNAGQNDSTSACAAFGTGETEDYVITLVAGSACTAPPTAGTAVSTATAVCPGSTVTLSLNGNSTGSGQTYQWLSSSNGTSWSPISGATGTSTTQTITAATYFACQVTCSGQSDTSANVMVGLNLFYNCYCTQGIGGGCTTTAIDSVAIATTTLDNGPTGCSTNNYTVYPASGNTTATLLLGMTYTMNTVFTGTVNCSMWIDYDHNGVFDTYEWAQVCTTSTAMGVVTSSFTVPMGAMTGVTGMRLRSRSTAGLNDSTVSCTVFGSGETEDYLVTISNGSSGVKQVNAAQLYVFPNPGNGIVNVGVSLPGSSKVNYQVVNVAGEVVYSEMGHVNGAETKALNLSGLSKGIYFIRVITDKEIAQKKIVLQ